MLKVTVHINPYTPDINNNVEIIKINIGIKWSGKCFSKFSKPKVASVAEPKPDNEQETNNTQNHKSKVDMGKFKKTYYVSGTCPNDICSELVNYSNDDINYIPENSDRLVNKCIILSAKINNCVGTVLVDSGVQISLISENCINKNKVQFKKVPILPVNNTVIKTTTDEQQRVNKQAFINIVSQGMQLEVSVLIIKNLIYDVILGTDTLKKVNAMTLIIIN